MEVFRGQYKQIANKQYEWTKRFIKSQLAGAEQLAIFKVQPNPNHTRTNQGSIRIKGLNAGTPNYKFSTLITQSHCFWRVRGSTWITNKELEKLTLKHRLTPLPPHSLSFITGHFPKLMESNVWHWLSTHICNKMRWSSSRHWLVKTRKTRFNLLG